MKADHRLNMPKGMEDLEPYSNDFTDLDHDLIIFQALVNEGKHIKVLSNSISV